MTLSRLLFASVHGYLDPSSGAATATRDLMELLATRGVDCRVLSTGVLDYEHQQALPPLLSALGIPVRMAQAAVSAGEEVPVCDFTLGGVRVSLLPTASSRIEHSPNAVEAAALLDLATQVLDRFRPQAMLTYGGHPANLALMAQARRMGIAVVFCLHNFAYRDVRCFADAAAVLVPTEFCRQFYAQRIGLQCTMIPYPFHPSRVLVEDREPRYLTFINPIPTKGVTFFARIADVLGRHRPDIPLLVVESRGAALNLERIGLDLSHLGNLHRMASTPDPRDFYRVTRAVLLPSLWLENGAMVAREAMANGIPVLASDRGGLPETLGDAGFVFKVPARYTPESGLVPTEEEVLPWVRTVERLWDDPAWEAKQSEASRIRARGWSPECLSGEYLQFFESVALRRAQS